MNKFPSKIFNDHKNNDNAYFEND